MGNFERFYRKGLPKSYLMDAVSRSYSVILENSTEDVVSEIIKKLSPVPDSNILPEVDHSLKMEIAKIDNLY